MFSTSAPHSERVDIERFLGGSVTVLGDVIYEQVEVEADPGPQRPKPSHPGA